MTFPNGTTEHPINKSGKKKILVSVWDFGAVHPQSERSHYLCNDHPAKMRPPLAKAILRLYGESPVLDPMAGIGTTLVEAMLLGMDAVGVDYERKFVDQANKNIEHIRRLFPNKNLGRAICVQGDARKLSDVLKKKRVKSILFSPPYFDALSITKGGGSKSSILHEETTKKLQFKRSEPFAVKKNLPTPYSSKRGNIGNIDRFGSIVFSPPYAWGLSLSGGRQYRMKKGSSQDPTNKHNKPYSFDQQNIGNIRQFGFIVFSPPYCGVMDAKRHVGGIASRDNQLAKTGLYSKDEENLGNLRRYGIFGSILFSPPYMDAIKGSGRKREEAIEAMRKAGVDEKRIKTFMGKLGCIRWQNEGYSLSKDQIGNLNGVTYLGEMFKVYRECYRALKPGKFMVVVVKDIQRDWKTIPLGADTIKLCQLAGFDLHDIIINKMYFPSFWILNLAKRSQTEANKGTRKFHALKCHEYVLIFRKPSNR